MTTWSGQNLAFTYYFPNLGSVFTGSPIAFVADGSPNSSTLANLSPATFSVTAIGQNELQISYTYPIAQFPLGITLTNTPFNGFKITGPAGDSPIIAAFVDPNSNVTGLISSAIGFTPDSVTVNLAGDHFSAGSVGLIDVQFAPPVPEPATWAMMILGFIGIGLLYRRKSKLALNDRLITI